MQAMKDQELMNVTESVAERDHDLNEMVRQADGLNLFTTGSLQDQKMIIDSFMNNANGDETGNNLYKQISPQLCDAAETEAMIMVNNIGMVPPPNLKPKEHDDANMMKSFKLICDRPKQQNLILQN